MAVVATSSLRVHLIHLHSVEDNIDGVGHETSGEASENASGQEVIEASHASWVRVELVIEVAEEADSSSGIAHSPDEEGIDSRQ